MRGTHLGESRTGVAPTGKEVAASIMGIFKLADGKIVEMWFNADFLGLMQQMGAFPAPPEQQEQRQPSDTLSSGQEPTY